VPVQSPVTGIQPGPPNAKGVKSGAPGERVFRRYQFPVEESNVPIPDLPVPVQSPINGIQPEAPNAKGAISGGPAEGLDRRYHVPKESIVPMRGRVAPAAGGTKHPIIAIKKWTALHLFRDISIPQVFIPVRSPKISGSRKNMAPPI
jgi:hypothetical protein